MRTLFHYRRGHVRFLIATTALLLTVLLCCTGTCLAVGERWIYVGKAQAAQIVGTDDQATEPEPLPIPPQSSTAESTTPDHDCTPSVEDPQLMLTVDIAPVNRPGLIDLDLNVLPPVCPAPVLSGAPTIFMDSIGGCGWPVWPGAQFCHRPLFFEERCLERCGEAHCNCCCQTAVSAAHFFGTAILLPVEFCCQCPGDCVWTPPY